MQRFFIMNEDTDYVQSIKKHLDDKETQRLFVCRFMEKHGIEAREYIVSGNGLINRPFIERHADQINFRISVTENDIAKFGKFLKVPCKHTGLRGFKVKSEIMKEFATACVAEGIVINLHSPQIRDYFSSIGLSRCSSQYFAHNEKYYLMANSEHLGKDDTPNGFTEIKASEYYAQLEELQAENEGEGE